MDDKTRKALTNPSTWSKGAVMLLFFLLLAVITPLLVLVSLVGWIGLLVGGRTPEQIAEFGQGLAAWYDRTVRYLTGSARRRPFPFEDLDCPADEPEPVPSAVSAGGGRSSSGRSDKIDSTPSGPVSDGPARPAPGDGHRPAGKASRKKAGGKKAARKKSTARKASRKKAVSKKSVAAKASKDADA